MAPQATHHGAVLAYWSATSLSLLFCLSKTQAAASFPAGAPAVPDVATDHGAAAAARGLLETGLMGMLESLLQTQLGVFVFSNFVIACCTAVAAVTTSVFLESLTPSEAGRLTQRLLKYLLFKVVLVGMVVLPSEVQLLHWLPWLAVIGEMKMFVGLAKDRLAGLSVTPTVGVSRHVRTLALLGFILCSNGLGLALLHRHTGVLSWAISLLFALDLGIISVEATKAALSCASLLMDEAAAISAPSLALSASLGARAMALWDSWQGRGRERFFYHTELLADVAVHLLTLLHNVHVWLLHGLSFHLLDAVLLLDTRIVVMSFLHRVKAHMMHRAATHSLDFTFPDATEKLLLAEEAECAICRDRLAAAKQLPCGHLFHLPCLRAWLQQSGHDNFKCPICRRTLAVQRSGGAQDGAAPGDRGAPGGAGVQARQRWRVAGQGGGPGLMGNLSLSMSYTDLSAAAGGVRQVSLEEQLLRGVQGTGFADDTLLGDAAGAQLLAAASLGSGSDAEGYDALLAQALLASLQTAQAAAASAAQQEAEEGSELIEGAGVGAARNSSGAADLSPAGDGSSGPAGGVEGVDASCDVAEDSSGQDQDSCSDSSSARTARRSKQLSDRTASLPGDLLSLSCWQGCAGCGCGGSDARGSAQQQLAGKEGEDTAGWTDPLSDSDCAQHSTMQGACSMVLPSLGAAGSSAGPSGAGRQQGHSAGFAGRLPRSQRYSRSCSHLPDLWTAAGGALSWPPAGSSFDAAAAVPMRAGASSAAAGLQGEPDDVAGVAALPAMELLSQPRDQDRRRQGGRWGRRRIVVSAAQQQQQQQQQQPGATQPRDV